MRKYVLGVSFLLLFLCGCSNQTVNSEKKVDAERKITLYSKLIEIAPEDPDSASFYNSRAWAYYALGQNDKGKQDMDKSIQLSQRKVKRSEEDLRKRWIQQQKDIIRVCDEVIASDPKNVYAYIEKANAYLGSEGKRGLEKALEIMNEAIKKNPLSPDAYETRSTIYDLLGQPEKAKQDYEKAFELEKKRITNQ